MSTKAKRSKPHKPRRRTKTAAQRRSAQPKPPKLTLPPLDSLDLAVLDIADGEKEQLTADEAHTPSTWAERYRVLTRRQTARFGPWSNETAPYLAALMDLAVDPRVRELTIVKPAQVGVSEAIRNVIGYLAHMEPDPVMLVLPSREKGREIMSERIIPMVEDTPALANLLTSDRGDKVKGHLVLANGFTLWLAWSGSATALASHPVRCVVNDEVDKFEAYAGVEADPLSLARARTQTYPNRLIINVSTPTVRGAMIHTLLEDSPIKLRWYVPCPECGVYQVLTFDRIRWEKFDEPDRVARAALVGVRCAAWYECDGCGHHFTEPERVEQSQRGVWLDESQDIDTDGNITGGWPEGDRVGVHVTCGACLWLKPWEVAATFIRAGRDPGKLQDFRNSWLGEIFEQQVSRPDTGLMKIKAERATRAAGVIPNWAGRLVMTADTQKDHFYYVVRAWGHDFRSARVDHGRVQTFQGLTDVLNRRYVFDDERLPPVAAQCLGIDTGGGESVAGGSSRTDEVYRFGMADMERVKLIKGVGRSARSVEMPLRFSKVRYSPPGSVNKDQAYEVWLNLLDVDHWKDILAARLTGVVELVDTETGEATEVDQWELDKAVDIDYERQMLSEQKIRIRKAGRAVEVWQTVGSNTPNHYWDCEVYQCAMAYQLRVDQVPPEHALTAERNQVLAGRSPSNLGGNTTGFVRGIETGDRPYLASARDGE